MWIKNRGVASYNKLYGISSLLGHYNVSFYISWGILHALNLQQPPVAVA